MSIINYQQCLHLFILQLHLFTSTNVSIIFLIFIIRKPFIFKSLACLKISKLKSTYTTCRNLSKNNLKLVMLKIINKATQMPMPHTIMTPHLMIWKLSLKKENKISISSIVTKAKKIIVEVF